MAEHLCVNCGAALPPTGTYCLACDTPVAKADSDPVGLSVAVPQVVRQGRPGRAIGVVVGAVLIVSLIVYGSVRARENHLNGDATSSAIRGVRLLMHAQRGELSACSTASASLAGPKATVATECRAIVGRVPLARIDKLHATAVERNGNVGTVDLVGTWVDAAGTTYPFRRAFSIADDGTHWLLVWNGQPISR